MTTLHHVYAIKNLLSHGPSSDDFGFSDRLIAHFLKIVRARLVKQKIDVSEQSYQSLCLDLEKASFHNCCTKPDLDCFILKSTIAIPKLLNSRWGNFLKVMDLEGRVIPEITLTQSRFSEYALAPTQTGWFLHDNRLYIIHNKNLTTVLLNGLFDNPEEIALLNCPASDDTCPSFLEQDFPLDPDLVDPMYKLTLELLLKARSLPNDLENNAKDITTAQAIQ